MSGSVSPHRSRRVVGRRAHPCSKRSIIGVDQADGMDEFTQDEVVSMICSRFMVADTLKGTYSIEFKIMDVDCTDRFADLARVLEGSRYICRLVEQNGDRYIIVQRYPAQKPSKIMGFAWTPRILFGGGLRLCNGGRVLSDDPVKQRSICR